MGRTGQNTMSTSVFHVLMALANGPNHGLGIADDVEAATDGVVTLGPGTLYRALKQMAESGLIREVDAPSPEEDSRRKHYSLTAEGRRALETEAERYRRVVVELAQRSVLPSEAGR